MDVTALGGSTITLYLQNGNIYTNTVTVPLSATYGSTNSLTVTAVDTQSESSTYVIPLVIGGLGEVWNGGAAPNNNWSTAGNWVNGQSPQTGDFLTFAGITSLTPDMNNSFSIGSLTFSSNAGGFNITDPTASYTLTLTGGVTNSSADVQTLSVPLTLGGTQSFNAMSNRLVVSNSVADDTADSLIGGVVATGTNTLILTGNNTYTGPTTVNAGTVVLAGNNTAAIGPMTNNAILQLANANAVAGSALTLKNGSTLQLRANAATTFTAASLAVPNAADVINFDAGPVTGGVTGNALTLPNTLTFLDSANQAVNVTGNSTYTLALGTVIGTTTAHNPYVDLAFNTLSNNAGLSISTIVSGNYSQWLNFQGGGNVTVTGNITNNSNGSAIVYVTDGTHLTLKGNSTLGGAATAVPDAFKYGVAHGTMVLDNNNALTNVTTGAGIQQSVFVLGAATNIFGVTGVYSPPAGVLVNTNNSWNAAVYLGDPGSTGGLMLNARLTNNVSDGDIGITNSGVFTIGGQNTSGINTYANPIILGYTANRGKSVTLVAATGGEVDFGGPILANGTDTTAGVTVGDGTHAGLVKLLGANTYAGGTTVTNGTLQVNGSIASGTLTVNNGSLVVNGTVGSGGTTLNGGSMTISATGSVGGGTVSVSNATLVVNGTLGSTTMNVLNGGILGGDGNINGSSAVVTVLAGGNLTPGVDTTTAGKVLATSAVNLNSGSTTTLAVSHIHATNDQVYTTVVTYGGTLAVITNAGDAPFQAGDTFQLFRANFSSLYLGSFTTINLPALNPGLGWTNTLSVNGSISVITVSTVNTNLTNMVAAVSGNVLTLSWPADHTGWRLLMQTNHLANGISSNTNDWTTVPGSSGVDLEIITNNPTLPGEFYRLVYP